MRLLCSLIIVGILLASMPASSNLYCKYSCDTNKARKAGQEFLETGTLKCRGCLEECLTRDLVPFFCEFFSVVIHRAPEDPQDTYERLARELVAIPHEDGKKLAGRNNYAYHILRNVSPSVCSTRLNVMSSVVPEEKHGEVLDKLEMLLETMNRILEEQYPKFKRYQKKKKRKVRSLPIIEEAKSAPQKKHRFLRLFNWCYNYCSGERAPKTFSDLEAVVRESPDANPGEIIDYLKTPPNIFHKKKHAHARRAYKCFTQCSIRNVERYLCYLLDEIAILDESKGEVPKKMLDVIGQILMLSSCQMGRSAPKQSKLATYLKNPKYRARCHKMFDDLRFRGGNYRINLDYLDSVVMR